MNKTSKIVEDFSKLMDEVNTKYNLYFQMAGDCDKATQDLLHKLELDNLNYRERAKIATQLANLRKDRRYYKDMTQILAPVKEWAEWNNKGVKSVPQMLGKIRTAEKNLENRRYTPRVLKEKEK